MELSLRICGDNDSVDLLTLNVKVSLKRKRKFYMSDALNGWEFSVLA